MYGKMEMKKYNQLIGATGLGSALGSGIIVGLSVTITLWQSGMRLTDGQVGILSGVMTFAIAAGSLLAGNLSKMFGMFRLYNYINIFYALGAVLCAFSGNFAMLFAGLVLCGFASGADLPISLTVLSHDAPDEATSARLIAIVQVFWQAGAFACTIMGFLVSRMKGTLGARVVFGMLAVVAVTAFLWRVCSGKVREFHAQGKKYQQEEGNSDAKEISFLQLFKGSNRRKYGLFFVCIIIYYCGWNLLSNTFGQFQTYILVKADASQFFATGIGIVLSVVGLFGGMLFTKIAGSSQRNKYFYIGIIVQAAAMFGIAIGGGSIVMMVIMIACYNMGTPFAGETMYKVWTQESFPMEARASVQGFINGFSRFLCGVFALITPMLVTAERIQSTMYGFSGLIIISAIAGSVVIHLQKKYGVVKM